MEQLDLPNLDVPFTFTQRGWKGVDLDGTLAVYTGWVGFSKIGAPVQKIVDKIVQWANEGWEVRILTARVAPDPNSSDISVAERVKGIRAWLDEYITPHLPPNYPPLKITHEKDKRLHEMVDDRCTQVFVNTGISVLDTLVYTISDAKRLLKGVMTDKEKEEFSRHLDEIFVYIVGNRNELPEEK